MTAATLVGLSARVISILSMKSFHIASILTYGLSIFYVSLKHNLWRECKLLVEKEDYTIEWPQIKQSNSGCFFLIRSTCRKTSSTYRSKLSIVARWPSLCPWPTTIQEHSIKRSELHWNSTIQEHTIKRRTNITLEFYNARTYSIKISHWPTTIQKHSIKRSQLHWNSTI